MSTASLVRHRAGHGPPVVLLPGLGTDWRVWSPIIPRLTEHASVLALDLPGLNTSPGETTDPSFDALADAVATDLAAQGTPAPLVVGNSLGGWVALELARRGLAGAVVAIAPAGLALGWERTYAATSLRVTRRAAQLLGPAGPVLAGNPLFRTAFFAQTRSRPWAVPPGLAAAELTVLRRAPAFDAVVDRVVARQTASRLGEIDRPVLVVWGGRDRLLPAFQARRFTDRIPGARLQMLPGAGHIPMTDDPGGLSRVILDFLHAGVV